MLPLSIHLAPHAPWPLLLIGAVALAALSVWAYGFSIPPLPEWAKRLMPGLRALALLLLLALLAQPVLERSRGGGLRIVALVDRSRSMMLPARPGGVTRAKEADRAVGELVRAWRGRAAVDTVPFAAGLGAGSGGSATAIGDALMQLARSSEGQRANGVVVVSDGAVNAGEDPVAAARALGVPVHAIAVGEPRGVDRSVTGVEAPGAAQVGHPTTVRVRVTSTEERGTPIPVHLIDDTGAERAHGTVMSPGGAGAEATIEFQVTPLKPGLAVWTARVDSLASEISTVNDARQVALEVAPGRIGVLIVSAGLNWDLTFFRRALLGDSSLAVTTFVRERGGWRALEDGHRGGALDDAALRGRTVVVLDGITAGEVSPAFDEALAAMVHGGGGLLAFGGPLPGLARLRSGRLGAELALPQNADFVGRSGSSPLPAPEARELLAWDSDPARGDRAWRAAAPLADLAPVAAGGGDRVLIESDGGGPPILIARRIGRGQALLLNGTGVWRWSLSGNDDLSGERGRALWRRITHWIAEPVQGEPLRVKPERWLTAGGEPVKLFATLQDAAFHPVAGAAVDGDVVTADGRTQHVTFEPRAAGTYVATITDPAPGRYRARVRATRGGKELGRAESEFAVDRWSLEEARTLPDSATLWQMAAASGGTMTPASQAARWARTLGTRTLARTRTESVRLWESPWIFAVVVGALCVEWAWRRRRGLP